MCLVFFILAYMTVGEDFELHEWLRKLTIFDIFDSLFDSEETMTYPESSERLFLGLDLSTQQVSSFLS